MNNSNLAETFIKQLKSEIENYRIKALEASENEDHDSCCMYLKKQGEAITTLINTCNNKGR